ncbi:MAG: hypothetical protein RML95_02260 [Anaerolineae bacterium]|nr:hypothetical protein [Anaerolineae bacterium]
MAQETLSENGTNLIFLINLGATLAMFGAIWIVQVVHYPLFSRVGIESFRAYETAHTSLITLVVMPLMFAELITAFLLALQPPRGTPLIIAWIGLGLVGVTWLSTAFIQVPLHSKLSAGFDASAHQALVTTNWIRTIAWSLRAVLVLWMTWRLLETR